MAAKSFTFTLTPAQLAAKQQQLAAQGVAITLPTGTIERDTAVGHVELAYAYDAATSALTVTIVRCPWLAQGRVESTINDWFRQ